MQNLGEIIIKIITFPFTLIRWFFYALVIYLFVFGVSTALYRYETMPSSLKPLYESITRINNVLLAKLTPHVEKMATRLEGGEQERLPKDDEGTHQVAEVKQPRDQVELVVEKVDRLFVTMNKLTEKRFSNMSRLMGDLNTQQKNNAFYINMSLGLAFLMAIVLCIIGVSQMRT
ncbi:MAG: hypothetical protein AAF380_03110 [Bacteroidota bacterium]